VVCTQDEPAQHVFAVVVGDCVATHAKGVFTMTAPYSFGENALYAEEVLRTRNATVRAGDSGCTLLSFPVHGIEALMGYIPQELAVKRYNRKLLLSVKVGEKETPLVDGLKEEQLAWLVDHLVEEAHAGGTVIGAEGSPDDRLQILKRGKATITSTKTPNEAPTELIAGDYYGERSLVKDVKRKTTVTAGPPQLLTVSLSAKTVKANADLDEWREALATLLPAPAAATAKSAKIATPISRKSAAVPASTTSAAKQASLKRSATTSVKLSADASSPAVVDTADAGAASSRAPTRTDEKKSVAKHSGLKRSGTVAIKAGMDASPAGAVDVSDAGAVSSRPAAKADDEKVDEKKEEEKNDDDEKGEETKSKSPAVGEDTKPKSSVSPPSATSKRFAPPQSSHGAPAASNLASSRRRPASSHRPNSARGKSKHPLGGAAAR